MLKEQCVLSHQAVPFANVQRVKTEIPSLVALVQLTSARSSDPVKHLKFAFKDAANINAMASFAVLVQFAISQRVNAFARKIL